MSQDAPEPAAPSPRWDALLQRNLEPLFLLDRRRRLTFVNRAWEALTGLSRHHALGLVCGRQRAGPPQAPLEENLAHALAPPDEVLAGAPGRARRLFRHAAGGVQWWDVDFFPLRQPGRHGEGFLLLGRITPVPAGPESPSPLLPEKLVALREQVARSFGPHLLDSPLPLTRRLAEQARLASAVRAPALLVGEPGTGKHTLARIIHYQGPRRELPFASLDCERLPGAAVARLLFGERPAPARSDLGTLYLRQPSSLARDTQLLLVQWLAGRPPEAEGPRVLAGLRARPDDEVRAGRLLPELACALCTLVIEVPPLRERLDDLPALVERLLERLPVRPAGLTPAAWDALRAHPWPGNLRELADVLAQAAARAGAGRVDAEHLPASVRLPQAVDQAPGGPAEQAVPLLKTLERVERRLIELALRRARGNKTRAAELLAIWRPRLLRRIEALGIAHPPDARHSPPPPDDADETGRAGGGE